MKIVYTLNESELIEAVLLYVEDKIGGAPSSRNATVRQTTKDDKYYFEAVVEEETSE